MSSERTVRHIAGVNSDAVNVATRKLCGLSDQTESEHSEIRLTAFSTEVG